MPRHCSAGGCKSRDNRETRKAGITFHKLPKGTTRRNLWITNSHRSGLWDPQTDFVYFCSKHFTPESFELTGYSGIRRLREDAFPTVFETSPDSKRKGPGRPRKQEDIQVRKKLYSLKVETAEQERIQEETDVAEKKDGEEAKKKDGGDGEKVKKTVPTNGGQHGPTEETDANILVSSQVTSEAENPSQQGSCASPPAALQSAPVVRPHSPSRYMRRLPPPPGFYLPKEHSYAQLCPLLWRRRYDRAIDCLEKALRQLNSTRRRENRLRNALLRLREKRLKHTLLFSRDGSKSKGSCVPGVENGQCRGGEDRVGRSSFLANHEESELDVETDDVGLCENRTGVQMDWGGHLTADKNSGLEEEGGYCFYCGRGREDDGRQVACRVPKSRKDGQPTVLDGKWLQLLKQFKSKKKVVMAIEAGASQESDVNYYRPCDGTEHVEDLQLVVLERPLGKGVETPLNLQRDSKLPIPQALLQTQAQVGLQQMTSDGVSLHETHVQYVQCGPGPQQGLILSDVCDGEGEHRGQGHDGEFQQPVFWIQESAEGQLLLVPVTTEDGQKRVVRMEGVAEDAQTILVSGVSFQRDFGQMTGDNRGQCSENMSRELRVEMASDDGHSGQQSNINSTTMVMREDVREKLKEHLEGFQLQLSNEFIN
ncbi:THAP domain-containing protein 7 [Polymixia lowei]